ncbi:MAG: hypothetical protein K2I03_12315 [Lachnospiraceae bacterium]|nr:hypothetical protein [Lachnospiraceae bacterium]
MKKIIKKTAALLLIILVISALVITDYTEAKATAAIPVAAWSAWEAIIGSAASYAGYNATRKQVSGIAGTSSTIVGDFINRANNALLPDVVTKAGYMDWVKLEWQDSIYYAAYKAWASAFYDVAKKWYADAKEDDLTDEQFLEATGELAASLANLNTEKPSDDDDKPNPWFKKLAVEIGGGYAIQVAVESGYKALSKLVDEIIKIDYNAEYEKMRGKYDWEKLGFISDYDTLNISKSSTSTFSGYKNINNEFNLDNTIIKTSLGGLTTCVSVYCGTEKIALTTIRNPATGLWKTVCLTEEQLYYFVNSVKTGSFTFSEIDAMITNNYIENDKTLPVLPAPQLASVNETASGYVCIGNDTFYSNFAPAIYGQNPLTVRYMFNSYAVGSDDTVRNVYLQKSNTTVYNIGKTLNVYFWNFSSETEYIGSTTALNGLDSVQPAVKKSIYTNVATEIDSKPTIVINIDKYYDNTDDQVADIAIDNDLNLIINNIEDNTAEINTTLTGIWNTLKLLPRNLYNVFGGILDKILKAIKDTPLKTFNLFNSPLQNIQNTLDLIARGLGSGITSTAGSDKIESILSQMKLSLDTIMWRSIILTGPGEGIPNTGLIEILINKVEDIASGTSLAEIYKTLSSISDKLTFTDIINAINSLSEAIKDLSFEDINDISVSIENSVSLAIKTTFVPEDDYLDNKFNDVNIQLKNKLPTETYTKFIGDLGEIEAARLENITIKLNMMKEPVTLINFDYYYDHKKEFEPYIKGVFFFLLLCFNIRHIYFLVRGTDFLTNPDNTTT